MGKRGALDEEIRAAGLKRTAVRVAVLRALRARRRAATHGDLYDELRAEGHDRSSVFRALNDLASAGLVRRIEPTEVTYEAT